MNKAQALKKAIECLGGQKAMADALRIKPPSVNEWVARGRAPAERCIRIEELTGVSRYELRPDVFGPAPRKSKRAA